MSSKAPALPIFRKTPPDLRPANPDRRPEYFLIFEIVCQVALLVPMLGAIRSVMRMAAFSGSLFMLAVTTRRARKAPAYKPALCVLIILAIAITYPTTNSWTAGFAQSALNLAIIAPLFWVPGLRI